MVDPVKDALDSSGDRIPIKVTVTDVFGESDSIEHTITKVDVSLPTVYLRPAGVVVADLGKYHVYPNTQ